MIRTFHREDCTVLAMERQKLPTQPGWPLAINDRREDHRRENFAVVVTKLRRKA